MTSTSSTGAALCTVLIVAAVAACSGPPPPPPRPPGSLAIVVGARNNMPAPVLPLDLGPVVDEAIASHDSFTVIGVSGTPRVSGPAEQLGGECDDADTCAFELEAVRSDMQAALDQVRADTPEADVLGALGVAARAGEGNPGRRQIVVVDNGLQTAGAFTLAGSRILLAEDEADLDALARRLSEEKRIEPALAGTAITWVGLAGATDPQRPADQRPRANLRLLWQKILERAGATVTFRGTVSDGGPPAAPDLPPVTPVDVIDTPVTEDERCPTVFDDQIGFVANQPTFRDPTRADDVLRPIAAGLVRRSQPARIVGYVALREEPGPDPLSRRRAEAVRDVLVRLGVPATLLQPVGGGLAPEAAGDGSEPPEKLAGYRRVEIRPGSCG